VTVSREHDKVKPNGKNWLNPSGNRPALPERYLPRADRAGTPAWLGFIADMHLFWPNRRWLVVVCEWVRSVS